MLESSKAYAEYNLRLGEVVPPAYATPIYILWETCIVIQRGALDVQ